jgi:hypothetical protein
VEAAAVRGVLSAALNVPLEEEGVKSLLEKSSEIGLLRSGADGKVGYVDLVHSLSAIPTQANVLQPEKATDVRSVSSSIWGVRLPFLRHETRDLRRSPFFRSLLSPR